MTVEGDEETDSLNVTVESNDGSLYVPTPQRKVRESIENTSIIPSSICFMDLKQLNKFINHFPNAEIMICGGHGGRAHKKQLEKLQSFTVDLIRKHKDTFPSVGDVVCHCSRHK